MQNFVRLCMLNTCSLIAVLLIGPSLVNAAVPYPGKLPATITHIEAANIINVNIETWPSFRRDVQIILPGLTLPGQSDNAAACELELAKKAYEFTVSFLSDAADISVQDMVMENSASTYAFSSIYTRSGTLDNALKREHLARPADLALNESWCE